MRPDRLTLPRCSRCARHVSDSRDRCRSCGATDIEWLDHSGLGRVHSHTVVRRGGGAEAPYVLAMVDLDEGLRVLATLLVTDPDAIEVGTRVRAVPRQSGEIAPLRFLCENTSNARQPW